MIIDGAVVPDGKTFEADVCVVGSGAAGLTVALELANRGLAVVLVESGGLGFNKRSHELLEIELSGQSTPALVNGTRERFFGGTTNHWGGVCRTLDAFEFETHSWVPDSGWPITRADLEPYYASAAKLIGLPELERVYDATRLGVADRPRLVGEFETQVQSTIWRRIPIEHLRMGQWRRPDVAASPLIQCVLNTTVAELHPHPSTKSIDWVEGRTFDNRRLRFRAQNYILCCGAVENARLMLASDSVVKGGLGNENDLVGRYFMDHPASRLGLLFTDRDRGETQEEWLGKDELVGWTTTPSAREEHRLQGFMAWLWPGNEQPEMPHARAIRLLARKPDAINDDNSPIKSQWIAVNWEQAPNPESRILLSDRRDALGIRLPTLHWELLPQDINSARLSAELLAQAVNRSGIGRINIQDITRPPLTMGGGHQMGTTRMSKNPAHGVTDIHGKVHSLDNLFICGSSLFPTGGWQHPTFTIVALALRLSDYLTAEGTAR